MESGPLEASGSSELVHLFLDADCALCTGAAKFLHARDRDARLRFHALSDPDPETVLARCGEREVRGAEAVLLALSCLPPPWPWLAALARLLPGRVREVLYRMIAKRRGWFGPSDSCVLPGPDNRPTP